MAKNALLLVFVFLILAVLVAGCILPEPESQEELPTYDEIKDIQAGTPKNESPVEEPVIPQPNELNISDANRALREAIETAEPEGRGKPEVIGRMTFEENILTIEYSTWDIVGGEYMIFEEQEILIVEIVSYVAKTTTEPTIVLEVVAPYGVDETDAYTTTLTWEEAISMANQEFDIDDWRDVTTHYA